MNRKMQFTLRLLVAFGAGADAAAAYTSDSMPLALLAGAILVGVIAETANRFA